MREILEERQDYLGMWASRYKLECSECEDGTPLPNSMSMRNCVWVASTINACNQVYAARRLLNKEIELSSSATDITVQMEEEESKMCSLFAHNLQCVDSNETDYDQANNANEASDEAPDKAADENANDELTFESLQQQDASLPKTRRALAFERNKETSKINKIE